MKPRFLLDEHIDHSIQRQLRRIDPHVDVIAIGDSSSPPVGTSDSDVLLCIVLFSFHSDACRYCVYGTPLKLPS